MSHVQAERIKLTHVSGSPRKHTLVSCSVQDGIVAHDIHGGCVALTYRVVIFEIRVYSSPRVLVRTQNPCFRNEKTYVSKSMVHPVAVAAASKHFRTFSIKGLSDSIVSDRIQ